MPASSSTTRILCAIGTPSSKPHAPTGEKRAEKRRRPPGGGRRLQTSGSSVSDLDESEEGDLGLGAEHVQPQVLALRRVRHDAPELLRRADGPSVDLRDDVPLPQARVGGWRELLDVRDEEALRARVDSGHAAHVGGQTLHGNADLAPGLIAAAGALFT